MAFADEMLWKQAQEAESLSSCSWYTGKVLSFFCFRLLRILCYYVGYPPHDWREFIASALVRAALLTLSRALRILFPRALVGHRLNQSDAELKGKQVKPRGRAVGMDKQRSQKTILKIKKRQCITRRWN